VDVEPLTLLPVKLEEVLVQQCTSRPYQVDQENSVLKEDPSEVRTEAIKRLLEVFGIEEPPSIHYYTKQAPQYMIDLYNTVADADGVTKDPDLLEGNTVRSFFDKSHSNQMEFFFNLSSVAKSERILTAELHLFKLKPHATELAFFNRHHFCQVSVYQVMDKNRISLPQGKKLLTSRLIPIHSSGWEVFTVTQAVRSWANNENSNHGLFVTIRTLGGIHLNPHLARFASGEDHHPQRQPMLVLFTDDGRRGTVLPNSFQDSNTLNSALPSDRLIRQNRTRTARSSGEYDEEIMPCKRHPLYVDFDEIGWSGWIISPRGYNAYHCKGSCPFPLGQSMRPTNHATVQSIINALKLNKGVDTPCCVPDKLFSINLLYFDDDGNVVLRQYDDMVAGSCGCH
ncbi:bone morphogenetic protein 2-like, partial [Protopterus annectens]|uniref:bone morphogenetic protein 2-like n=1 Tax=Protopterus annectens TaxID=7888 RepID=UPI001CF98924